MASKTPTPLLIVELNEFNVELLTNSVAQHDLPHLAKVLNFPRTHYKTQDRYNSGYLEPWVQWVSIHSGKPSSVHKIKHLGDVPDLNLPQCWEVLGEHGISTGIWGVMNGEKRQAKQVRFFLPDPWTFSEWATPNKLNHLLDLPRYVSKNYQNLSKTKILFKAMALLKFVLTSGTARKIFSTLRLLRRALKQYGKKHFIYISLFDYVSTLLFIQQQKKSQPQCSILFLNSLAHLQHHHWTQGTSTVTPQILFGLQIIDKILSELFTAFPDHAWIVHNGLSQMNTNHEKPWILYRQKDPLSFFKALGLPVLKVEQLMTHDGHAFFECAQECLKAFLSLSSAKINNKSLFHVEINPHDPKKLFYQLKFTDKLSNERTDAFIYNGKSFDFFNYFDEIVTRTGRHIPIGTVYSSHIKFHDHMYNHEFNQHLYHYFLPEKFNLKSHLASTIQATSDESELVGEV